MAIKIKNGKKELNLLKSNNLVGLKTNANADQKPLLGQIKEVFDQHLGGFNVVQLNKGNQDIDSKLDDIRKMDAINIGTHVYYTEGSNRPIVPTGDIYIQFQPQVTAKEQQLTLDEFNLTMVERRDQQIVLARVTPASSNPLKVAQALANISLVKWVEPDLDIPLDSYEVRLPTDSLLVHQWHLRNTGVLTDSNWRLKKGADAKVIDAWQRMKNLGSSNIVLAIVDNGFDLAHPDLKDKIFKPFDNWSNSTQIPGKSSGQTHGTPCASVALAANNTQGIVGVAPNAKFMPVHGTSFSTKVTEQMFDYCIKNGADIISCSWGTTDSNFSLNAMKEAAITRAAREGRKGKGCIILFAVGNDDLDFVNFYAAHPDVIAVAASNSQDAHATYSNRGREVSVCAPSNGDWPIIAARASWDEGIEGETGEFKFWRDGRSRGNLYKHFGGTSSACPLVAGICALMLSVNPDLTAKAVKSILEQTADKIGTPSDYVNGHSTKYGFGRVNADRAVAEAMRRRDAANPLFNPGASGGQGLFKFSVERQAAQGWGVQIGAFADYANVLIQSEKLQRQFNAPVILNINEIDGKTVYKMLLGAYSTADEAKQLEQRMLTAGVKGFVRNLADLK